MRQVCAFHRKRNRRERNLLHFCFSASLAMEQSQAASRPSSGFSCAKSRPRIGGGISAINVQLREMHRHNPIAAFCNATHQYREPTPPLSSPPLSCKSVPHLPPGHSSPVLRTSPLNPCRRSLSRTRPFNPSFAAVLQISRGCWWVLGGWQRGLQRRWQSPINSPNQLIHLRFRFTRRANIHTDRVKSLILTDSADPIKKSRRAAGKSRIGGFARGASMQRSG
jgi:hypothetical protein